MTGLLERDVLVISQEAKLIEMTNKYRILDPEGEEVGGIHEEAQSKAKKPCTSIVSRAASSGMFLRAPAAPSTVRVRWIIRWRQDDDVLPRAIR
jgi:hypothetical protein